MPDRRRNKPEALRVGGVDDWAGGRGRGQGAKGRPLLRLQLPALWLRLALTLALFPEPRDVTGKQPIVVGTHRSPGAGHPEATRGGHHLECRAPLMLTPFLGDGPRLGTPAPRAPPTVARLASGATLRGVGWGLSALSWGLGAPSRAGEEPGGQAWL